MGLKIVWQDLFPEGVDIQGRGDMPVYYEGMLRGVKKVAKPDTEVTVAHLDRDYGSMHYLYLNAINVVKLVNKIIQHEEKGYDAVIIDCIDDIALQQARGAVKIPVMGGCESGMLVAQLLGRKFAVVTVNAPYVGIVEANLHQYRWISRAIESRPVRAMGSWYWGHMIDAFRGKPEGLIRIFEEVALKCINDGADTIICGCVPAGFALTLAGYREIANTGVPFISPGAAAVKLAEVMADLQHSIGLSKTEAEAGSYQTLPRQILLQVRKDFGF